MERESFEDEGVADFLNQHLYLQPFISCTAAEFSYIQL